jgi:Protein of unknown function (DUF1115)
MTHDISMLMTHMILALGFFKRSCVIHMVFGKVYFDRIYRSVWLLLLFKPPDLCCRPPNKCDLVWQGTVKSPAFDKFYQEIVRTDRAARKFLEDRGIANYWDIARALAQAEEPPL